MLSFITADVVEFRCLSIMILIASPLHSLLYFFCRFATYLMVYVLHMDV